MDVEVVADFGDADTFPIDSAKEPKNNRKKLTKRSTTIAFSHICGVSILLLLQRSPKFVSLSWFYLSAALFTLGAMSRKSALALVPSSKLQFSPHQHEQNQPFYGKVNKFPSGAYFSPSSAIVTITSPQSSTTNHHVSSYSIHPITNPIHPIPSTSIVSPTSTHRPRFLHNS